MLTCKRKQNSENRFRVIFGTKKQASSDVVILPPRNILISELSLYL
jgi:hypothetical protein